MFSLNVPLASKSPKSTDPKNKPFLDLFSLRSANKTRRDCSSQRKLHPFSILRVKARRDYSATQSLLPMCTQMVCGSCVQSVSNVVMTFRRKRRALFQRTSNRVSSTVTGGNVILEHRFQVHRAYGFLMRRGYTMASLSKRSS